MDFILQNFFWVAVAIASAAGLVWLGVKGDGAGISQQDAVMMMNRESATVLDVRDKKSFEAGHLPGARNVPYDNLELDSKELDRLKGRPCIVYCERGTRAEAASKILAGKGFDKIYVLAGGMDAWVASDMPVEH